MSASKYVFMLLIEGNRGSSVGLLSTAWAGKPRSRA